MQRIAGLLTLLRDDPPTNQLLDLWYSAMEYERRAFDLVDLEHMLIRYVKVFERVAKAMSPELREAVDTVAEATAIEAELARLAAGATSPERIPPIASGVRQTSGFDPSESSIDPPVEGPAAERAQPARCFRGEIFAASQDPKVSREATHWPGPSCPPSARQILTT